MKSTFIGLMLVLFAFFLPPSHVAAQVSSGKILGVVTDDSSAVLPGALIAIRNLGTGVTRDVVSNERGQYDVPGLPPGRYQVEAELTVSAVSAMARSSCR